MPEPHDEYNLGDLCRTLDVTPRTVRYYVAQGLLPPPVGAGQAARYGDRHVGRLRLIRQLQRQHLPLAEIRARLAVLTDDAIRDLVETPSSAAGADESALDYIRAILGSVGPTVQEADARVPVPPTQAQRRAYASLASSAPSTPSAPSAPSAPLTPSAPSAPPTPSGRPETFAESAPRAGRDDALDLPVSPVTAAGLPVSREGDARDDGPMDVPARSASVTGSDVPALDHVPLRSQWDRIELAPDIELHLRRPLSRIQNRRIERLIAIARELLEED